MTRLLAALIAALSLLVLVIAIKANRLRDRVAVLEDHHPDRPPLAGHGSQWLNYDDGRTYTYDAKQQLWLSPPEIKETPMTEKEPQVPHGAAGDHQGKLAAMASWDRVDELPLSGLDLRRARPGPEEHMAIADAVHAFRDADLAKGERIGEIKALRGVLAWIVEPGGDYIDVFAGLYKLTMTRLAELKAEGEDG